MRKAMILTVLAVFFLGSSFAAAACVVCDERVDGNTVISVLTKHGDADTGGNSLGNARSAFSAAGLKSASGEANTQGIVYGDSLRTLNTAFANSSSDVSSIASGNGNCFLKLEISGFAGQANWAIVGDGINGAVGNNYTEGSYNGVIGSSGNRSLSGGASASGSTNVYNFSGPQQSGGITAGSSTAWLQGLGDPKVFGIGNLASQSYLSNGISTGLAQITGNATYSASGPTYAHGSLSIFGSTTVNMMPNGVSASSNINSTSSANSR